MILPDGSFVHYEVNSQGDETYQIISYIDNQRISSFSFENVDAYLVGYMDSDECFAVTSLYSREVGKRHGTSVLFLTSIFLSIYYPHIKYITLDDCSGLDPPRNLYYRLGFQVKDETTRKFINWDNWISKYDHNPSEERRIRVPFSLRNIDI